LVQAPDTHSAEAALIVWHPEQWFPETISSRADNPASFLVSAATQTPLDFVQIATNTKKMYRETIVGNSEETLPCKANGDERDIQPCLDYMRHFVNRAKYVRYEGFVYATDLSRRWRNEAFVVQELNHLLPEDV
jgi:hypothetical protein